MRLNEYLRETKTSKKHFAEAIGVARQTLHRYIAREREPSFETLAKIRDATGGKVTPDDFVEAREPEQAAG